MKNLYLIDATLCGANTPIAEPEPDIPGALLPDDFPKSGLTSDQLVELEEWYLTHTRTAILRIFKLLHTTRAGGPPTPTSVLHCVAVLAKLLGLNNDMTWTQLAEGLNSSPSAITHLKKAMAARMATFAAAPTPAELFHTATILSRTARRNRLMAAILASTDSHTKKA